MGTESAIEDISGEYEDWDLCNFLAYNDTKGSAALMNALHGAYPVGSERLSKDLTKMWELGLMPRGIERQLNPSLAHGIEEGPQFGYI